MVLTPAGCLLNDSMDTDEGGGGAGGGCGYWHMFVRLVAELRELHLLSFFADHTVAEVVHDKVRERQGGEKYLFINLL